MWISAGWTSFFVVLGICWAVWPRMAPIADPGDRALFALQLCAAPAVVMLMMLQTLWRIGDTPQAEDPFANAESQRFKLNHRVFSNTLEQMAIFLPMFLALAIRIDPSHVFLLSILMAIWCAGRLLFWGGYHVGNNQRAIGMDWTSGTATVTLLALIWTLF